VLKTDEEARLDRERVKQICLILKVQYLEEAFERYYNPWMPEE
jgi:hypothetical protein